MALLIDPACADVAWGDYGILYLASLLWAQLEG